MHPITTDRLLLRDFGPDDDGFILTLLNDPSFTRFIGDRNVRTLAEARNYIMTGPVESYKRYGFGLYVVELKPTKTPIGMCGLLKRDALEHPDIGFAFLPEYRHQGYATEASRAVLSLAKNFFRLPRVLAITDPDNQSSIGLLEKVGFNFERLIRLTEDSGEVKLFAVTTEKVEDFQSEARSLSDA